jgi:alpha-methylacyl-CoA racemase
VLSLDEAHLHPHNVERGTFKTINGVLQPGPAPRYSRTEAAIQGPAAHPGQHTDDVLSSFGFDSSEIAKLREAGAVK